MPSGRAYTRLAARRARRRKRTVRAAGVRGTDQALTREQMALDTHADTPDTRHSRARAETPLKP